MGKMKALEKLHALSREAKEKNVSLSERVRKDSETGPLLSPEDLQVLDNPEQYIGHAVEIVDKVIEEIKEKRKGD